MSIVRKPMNLIQLKRYLSPNGRDVSMDEFKEFYTSCTEDEMKQFKADASATLDAIRVLES